MAIDPTKITKNRQAARDEVRKAGAPADPVIALELQYIADSLEAIRGELALLGNVATTIASKPPGR